ncbi:hypothetical protein IFM89_000803 [Coptis chinensis]|uniref:Uncharacterized protein n=1 Tax=Coptis chinensis TaxID=261450 RepID=A0A835ITF2_9MAGN|nr:hypothetical protein IFM89_000803 [Coptis chinensis]
MYFPLPESPEELPSLFKHVSSKAIDGFDTVNLCPIDFDPSPGLAGSKTRPSCDDDHGSKNNKAVSTDLSSNRIEEYLGQENLPSEWWALLIGWELRQLWSLYGFLKLVGASMAILEIQGLAFIIMFRVMVQYWTCAFSCFLCQSNGLNRLVCYMLVVSALFNMEDGAVRVDGINYAFSYSVVSSKNLSSHDKAHKF